MIVAAVISGPPSSGMRSLSTISARARSTGCRLRLANAVTRISAPSSSRMLVEILRGDELEHLVGGADSRSWMAFLRRIAMRVSRSGGWTSVIRPHSNRLRSRSSKP